MGKHIYKILILILIIICSLGIHTVGKETSKKDLALEAQSVTKQAGSKNGIPPELRIERKNNSPGSSNSKKSETAANEKVPEITIKENDDTDEVLPGKSDTNISQKENKKVIPKESTDNANLSDLKSDDNDSSTGKSSGFLFDGDEESSFWNEYKMLIIGCILVVLGVLGISIVTYRVYKIHEIKKRKRKH